MSNSLIADDLFNVAAVLSDQLHRLELARLQFCSSVEQAEAGLSSHEIDVETLLRLLAHYPEQAAWNVGPEELQRQLELRNRSAAEADAEGAVRLLRRTMGGAAAGRM